MRKAVIDVGSNSVILTIGELVDGEIRYGIDHTRVTSLGEGTKQTGLLSDGATSRTLNALAELFTLARTDGASEVIAYATMAARIARNTPEFLEKAAQQGTPVEVLSGEDEAAYGLECVTSDPAMAGAKTLTIIDPGGQSTEIATACRVNGGWQTRFRRSFPIGTLALRSGVLANPSPGPSELLPASAEIDECVNLEYLPGEAGQAVVLGATGTNLISIREAYRQWQPDKVHAATLTYPEVSRFVASLCELDDAGRAAVIGMEPGREKTIHIGALILERFMYILHVVDVKVSVRGWRHALLARRLQGEPCSTG